MKIKFSLALNCLIVLGLCGCSIDVAAPAIPTPSSEPGPASPTPSHAISPDNLTIPAPQTKVPITWADLNVTGKLVYISVDTLDNTASPGIQVLDLATGGVATIFRAPQGAWIFYLAVSPDGKQLIMSFVPPSQPGSISSRALYILPLDGSELPQLLIAPPTPSDHYTQAEWSSDGEYIYYVHYNDNDKPDAQLNPLYDISRMRYPNGQPGKIVNHAFWPRISSDSSKLVYVFLDPVSGRNELFMANPDGSNPRKIAFSGSWTPEIMDAPIFSPDGQSILFSAPPPAQAYRPTGSRN